MGKFGRLALCSSLVFAILAALVLAAPQQMTREEGGEFVHAELLPVPRKGVVYALDVPASRVRDHIAAFTEEHQIISREDSPEGTLRIVFQPHREQHDSWMTVYSIIVLVIEEDKADVGKRCKCYLNHIICKMGRMQSTLELASQKVRDGIPNPKWRDDVGKHLRLLTAPAKSSATTNSTTP